MGNCFALQKFKRKSSCYQSATIRYEKFFRVVKTNAKIIKDMLMNFPGCDICLSDNSLGDLPQNYKLKVGNAYNLIIPSSSSVRLATPASDSPVSANMNSTDGSKRIKLIITKRQLQELLSKKISVEERCCLSIQKDALCGPNCSSSRWQPVLETIPEGSEW